jgi:hypothetical protein
LPWNFTLFYKNRKYTIQYYKGGVSKYSNTTTKILWYITTKPSTTTCKLQTSWSLLGPWVELGLAPNIMKGINIFIVDVIKDFPYNYDRIIPVLWKKCNKKKNLLESVWNDATCHTKISDCVLSP